MTISIDIDADLDLSQRKAVTKALDLMGAALASHGHQWTDEERGAYEQAIAAIQQR